MDDVDFSMWTTLCTFVDFANPP
jgi:FtsH-binding integral membrane protein